MTMIPALGEFAYEPEPVIATGGVTAVGERSHQRGRQRLERLDRSARGTAAERRQGLARGRLVWHGPADRPLRDPARRRDRRQVDRAVSVVGRRASPATGPMLCRKWMAARLMAARRRTPRWSPRSRISRPAGSRDLLSVHRHGHRRRQRAARSLRRRQRPTGLSLARAHHLRSGAARWRHRRPRPATAPRKWRPLSAAPSRPTSPSTARRSIYSGPTNGASAASFCIAPISARRQAASTPSSWAPS